MNEPEFSNDINEPRGYIDNSIINALLEAIFDVLDMDGKRSILNAAGLVEYQYKKFPEGKSSINILNKLFQAILLLLQHSSPILEEIGKKFSFYWDPQGTDFSEFIKRLNKSMSDPEFKLIIDKINKGNNINNENNKNEIKKNKENQLQTQINKNKNNNTKSDTFDQGENTKENVKNKSPIKYIIDIKSKQPEDSLITNKWMIYFYKGIFSEAIRKAIGGIISVDSTIITNNNIQLHICTNKICV